MTLYEKIALNEELDVKALYYEDKAFSYKELMINIRKMANYFKKHGIEKGDVVTVSLPNIPSTVYTLYALDALGVVQNIVHPLTPVEKVIETMKDTGSKAVVLLATAYGAYEKLFQGLKEMVFFANPMHDNSLLLRYGFFFRFKRVKEDKHLFLLDRFHKEPECRELISREEKETSIFLHSGGTTGNPKVICLSDYAINNLVDKAEYILGGSMEGKAMLAVLPIFHGFGLAMGVHTPLANGGSCTLMMKFNPKQTIRFINENKINLMIGVPQLFLKLLKQEDFAKAKLSNLEYAFIGGDNVPPSLIADFDAMMETHGSACRLAEGYGLTENVTVCSVNTREFSKAGSVGKALIGLEVKILDEDLKELSRGEVGELYLTGDTLMNGYRMDERTTAEALVRIEGKIWLRTGDLAYLDEEGYIFLKGRKKRMFKISGMNVYPSEVEKIATDNVDIADAALEFFPEPSPHMILYLIKKPSCKRSEAELKALVMTELARNVLKYSMPKSIIFMDKFPETTVGKIDHSKFEDQSI